jgi:hypothetical protein
MPLKRKPVTISFLSLGFIVIAIGIARLFWLRDAFKGKTESYSVTSAYSAIESSIAIIGTSGPTVKYILSSCLPWLRPSSEQSSLNEQSNGTYGYGNHSNTGGSTRRTDITSGYDDLDGESVELRTFEMKSEWGNGDAQSDKEMIVASETGQWGIMKSVEWTVNSTQGERNESIRVEMVAPIDRF